MMVALRLAVVGLMLLAGAAAVLAMLRFVSPSSALAGASRTLTFQGTTRDGGEISITFTPDRKGIERLSIRGMRSPLSQRVLSGTQHFDPPDNVEQGSFTVTWSRIDIVDSDDVTFTGSFVSENEVRGSYRFHSYLPDVNQSAPAPFALVGPVAAAPSPDDQLFEGNVGENQGRITLALNQSVEQITATRLSGVLLPPCTDPDNPLDVNMIFQPPFALSSPDQGMLTNGEFAVEVQLIHDGKPWMLEVDGTMTNSTHVAGSVHIREIAFRHRACWASASWSTVAAATAVPSPTSPAPQALPQTGVAGSGGLPGWAYTFLPVLAAAVFFAFVAGARLRRRA